MSDDTETADKPAEQHPTDGRPIDLRIARLLEHPLAIVTLLSVIAAILVARISSFGIWDPWELNAADAARQLLEGETIEPRRAPLTTLLMSWSFGALGVSELAGRLPMVIGGLLTALVAFWLGRRFGDTRSGLIAALVAASTPLFLLNSKQMLGDALGFAATGTLGVLAAILAFDPPKSDPRKLALLAVSLVVAVFVGVSAGGGLLVVLPPLAAVALVLVARGRIPAARDERAAAGFVLLIAAYVAARVVAAVVADQAEFSAWIGGAPRGGAPPSFEVALEKVFHGFAPWSGIALLALVRMLSPAVDADPPSRDTRLMLVIWAALSYSALTVYTARYGSATYQAVVPLAVAVALYLRDIERSQQSWWPDAIIGALLVGLVIRDYALYPSSPIRGLPVDAIEVPEGASNPRLQWAAVLGLVVVTLVLGLGAAGARTTRPDISALRTFVRAQRQKGPVFRGWLVVCGVLFGGMVVFGALVWVAGDALPFTSLVVRTGRYLLFVPPAILAVALVVPWVLYAFDWLGEQRLVPLFVTALACSIYTSQVYLPELSSHFSPREVYDTYNELRREGEPLAEYRVSGRAAAYYAVGEVQDLRTQQDLMQLLGSSERQWAVIPADELASLNREFRQSSGRHLFVADARSARVLLVSNQEVSGRANENFVANAVLDEPPPIQHASGGVFDNRIELLGYDLDLPQAGFVGPGQAFKVRWYWRCIQRVPGAYKIFLHVDGAGNRLNGDHEPVNERYPVRLWEEGDIVVDEQELRVPANYRPGRYTFWIGFYSGNSRLEVTSGDEDDANRLNAGTLTIR